MNEQLGNSTAEPQSGNTADESIDVGDLEGLLPFDGEGTEDEAGDSAGGEHQAQPDGEEADDAESKAETPQAITDDTEVELDTGRKVSVREMKETFAAFSQKTQELAEAKRETFAQARNAVAQIAEQRANEMALLADNLMQLVVPGFSDQALLQLASTDPQQFYVVKPRVDMVREQQNRMRQQAQQLSQQAQEQREIAQQEQQQAHQQLLAGESKKLEGQKWWNADFQKQAVAFAKKHGIPEQVAGTVAYAGFVEITRKAMLYDQAVARAKTGKVAPTQAAARPGATPARGQMQKIKQVSALYDRARKSGDRADIGRAIDSLLPAI